MSGGGTATIDELVPNLFCRLDKLCLSLSKCFAQSRSAEFAAEQLLNIGQKLKKGVLRNEILNCKPSYIFKKKRVPKE